MADTAPSLAPPAPEQTRRLSWPDVARGLVMAVVVLGHCWDGLASAGMDHAAALWRWVEAAFALFRMPAFFIVGGFFLIARVQATRLSDLGVNLTLRLVYPLFIWTPVFTALRVLAGGSTTTQVSLGDIFRFPLPPMDHFWFLWSMFLLQLGLAIVITLWPQSHRRPTLWYTLAALTGVSWFFVPYHPTWGPWYMETLAHLPFICLGVGLGISPYLRSALPLPVWLAALGFVLLDGFAVLLPQGPLVTTLGAFVTSVCLLRCVQWLSDRYDGTKAIRALIVIGRYSMPIFLVHTAFTAATRIALSKLGIEAFVLHVTLGTLMGILGPLGMFLALERLRLARWLGLS
ncbi:MAG: acyltransferase [Pelagimonas sp.]|nr:acyltransferase [Pelagimonas sp.]